MFLAYCLGNSSAAVVPGGAAAREVLEGLCEGGDGLSGLAIEKVRVEGWRDGMVWEAYNGCSIMYTHNYCITIGTHVHCPLHIYMK